MTAAILVFSFLAFAFSSIVMMPGMKEPLFGLKGGLVQTYTFAPPERRAVIVDGDGLAHPTADQTHSTKRDRSRRVQPEVPTPSLNIVSGEASAAVTMTEPPLQPVPAEGGGESVIIDNSTQEEKGSQINL